MKHEKLVRDRIIAILQSKGETASFHTAEDTEFKKKLKEKLLEEVNEFLENDSPEELSDILEVIDALLKFPELNRETVLEIKRKKYEERGGFEQRIILDETKA